MTETLPYAELEEQSAPHLVIQPSVQANDGSEWVHKDYQKVTDAWAVEEHIGPIKETARFGDVESWAEYIKAYTSQDVSGLLLTWSDTGLRAVLDYHNESVVGRGQWIAEHPFKFSSQWQAWSSLANGQPRPQKQLVESLEDLGEDIVSPDQAALLGILRTLRTTTSASGETVINPDGSTSVSWTRESTVKGKAEIPATIAIKIPVLKGHYRDGNQVVYEIPIRMRLSVDDGAHVLFRLSMPTAERVLEKVYADRVQAAKDALGAGYSLLRAG